MVGGECSHLPGFVDHRLARLAVKALSLGVGDGERLELHEGGHVEVVFGVVDSLLEGGREDRDRVAAREPAEAEFDCLGAADPEGPVVARGLLRVRVELRLRDRHVIVLVGDRQAEGDLLVGEYILGKSRCGSINRSYG